MIFTNIEKGRNVKLVHGHVTQCHSRIFLMTTTLLYLTCHWRADKRILQGKTSLPLNPWGGLHSLGSTRKQICRTTIVLVGLGGLVRFHCFCINVLASKWGCLYGNGVRKMVCRSGEPLWPVYHVSRNIVSLMCQARNANSVVLSISILGPHSVQPSSQSDAHTSDLSRTKGLGISALSISGISDISKTISYFIHWSKCMYLI